MAERKSVNKYIPPDWSPSQGGVNHYRKVETERSKARKYLRKDREYDGKTTRFEMPFDIFCNGCEKVIAKGTRFNAGKLEDGEYFSTKIYKFTIKCAGCKQKIVIKTNPKDTTYDVVEGGRIKNETFLFEKEDHAIVLEDDETKERVIYFL
jgi:coiled-coil domain-containing protein 130